MWALSGTCLACTLSFPWFISICILSVHCPVWHLVRIRPYCVYLKDICILRRVVLTLPNKSIYLDDLAVTIKKLWSCLYLCARKMTIDQTFMVRLYIGRSWRTIMEVLESRCTTKNSLGGLTCFVEVVWCDVWGRLVVIELWHNYTACLAQPHTSETGS